MAFVPCGSSTEQCKPSEQRYCCPFILPLLRSCVVSFGTVITAPPAITDSISSFHDLAVAQPDKPGDVFAAHFCL